MAVSLVMTACGTSVSVSTEADDVTEAEEEQEEDSEKEQEGSETSEPQEESDSEEAAGEEAFETGGGSPWIDSNLKENITEDMVLSEKDDFRLYVDYEWLLDAEIPAGQRNVSSFTEVAQETIDKAQMIFEDENPEGHEISHAFDINGSQFGKIGDLDSWWTEEDYNAFMEKARKLAAYYNGITVYGDVNVIGENIVSEAIADMAGVKCLPAIASEEGNFDYDVFFRQYTKLYKRITTPVFENYVLTQDTHPLSYLRVNVGLQQFDEFYDTYDIQPGDSMYLAEEDRILVW